MFQPPLKCQSSPAGQSLIQPLLEQFEHKFSQNSPIKTLFQPTLGPISALGSKLAQGPLQGNWMVRVGPDLREPNYTQKIGLHFTNRNGPIFRVNRSFWSTVYNQDFNFERRAPAGQVIVTVIHLFPPIFPSQKCRCFTWRRRTNRVTKLVNRGHEQPQHYRSLLSVRLITSRYNCSSQTIFISRDLDASLILHSSVHFCWSFQTMFSEDFRYILPKTWSEKSFLIKEVSQRIQNSISRPFGKN